MTGISFEIRPNKVRVHRRQGSVHRGREIAAHNGDSPKTGWRAPPDQRCNGQWRKVGRRSLVRDWPARL